MSFAILRHGKISSTSRGVAIAHNHRLGNIDQVNIDKGMKHLNRCFMGEGLADRIDALLPKKIRKDAVVSVELLLTSGPEFFDAIEKDRTKLSKNPKFLDWVKKTMDWAKAEFGNTLVDFSLHMDESTPHIHAMAVPLTPDGRLCAKEVMGRKAMQDRQTGYAKAMEIFGLKRGDPASETKRRHIGLKENPASGGKSSQEKADLATAQAQLARLRSLSREWTKQDAAKIEAIQLKLTTLSLENEALKAETKDMKLALKRASERDHKLVAELQELRKTKPATQASAEVLRAVDNILVDQAAARLEKEAGEAFKGAWGGLGQATKTCIAVGTPVAAHGRSVVLHIGRGKHVMWEVPDGQPIPQVKNQAEQQKGGITR